MRLVILLLVSLPAVASADAVDALVEQLQGLRSLEGDFQQRTVQDQQNVQKAQGTMIVKRPNQFRWQTRKPFKQLVVSNGKKVWVNDPGLEQVVIRPLDRQISKTPALLFGGKPDQIGESFQVDQLEADDDQTRFRLKPEEGEDQPLFSNLTVTFEDGKPASMKMKDALGQSTTIRFKNLEVNTDPDADHFTFTPPEGADVIRQNE